MALPLLASRSSHCGSQVNSYRAKCHNDDRLRVFWESRGGTSTQTGSQNFLLNCCLEDPRTQKRGRKYISDSKSHWHVQFFCVSQKKRHPCFGINSQFVQHDTDSISASTPPLSGCACVGHSLCRVLGGMSHREDTCKEKGTVIYPSAAATSVLFILLQILLCALNVNSLPLREMQSLLSPPTSHKTLSASFNLQNVQTVD